MRSLILQSLESIESQEVVRIIYACESGSRAWGFPSLDSDYDVRFIYAHPPEWYLSVQERRDVIEKPVTGQLDISGWDIRKALRLLGKSNPSIVEWLASPIIYREDAPALKVLKELRTVAFSLETCIHHYLSMARGNYGQHLHGEMVKVKKYFYALRPVLACMWIEQNGTAPPLEFSRLLDAFLLPGPLREAIDRLLERKKAGEELAEEPRIDAIHTFLDEQMAFFDRRKPGPGAMTAVDPESLDTIFRNVLRESWR